MYQRARKLQDIVTNAASFVSLAEDQLEALSVAINALYLVDEKAAWILMPVVPDPVRILVMMFINASQNVGFLVSETSKTFQTYSGVQVHFKQI